MFCLVFERHPSLLRCDFCVTLSVVCYVTPVQSKLAFSAISLTNDHVFCLFTEVGLSFLLSFSYYLILQFFAVDFFYVSAINTMSLPIFWLYLSTINSGRTSWFLRIDLPFWLNKFSGKMHLCLTPLFFVFHLFLLLLYTGCAFAVNVQD